jgi:uncharacterized protein
VRVSTQHRQLIIESIGKFIDHFDLYLFGSRADDKKKGGDIDLLLLVPADQIVPLTQNRYKILLEIKQNIGNQKIDLVIRTINTADDFVDAILPMAVKLNR